MQLKTVVRGSALVTSVALLGLSGGPAMAADVVAQASASGATVAAGGQTQDSGTYTVTNDGSGERTTGTNKAALQAVGGQTVINFGTVAQDATTKIVNGEGISLACAGAAGQGASVAAVGSGSCLTGGDAVKIADSINLNNVTLSDSGVLTNVPAGPLLDAVKQTGITQQLNDATAQLFAALGNPAVTLSLGALQSSCQADSTSASGTANLANAGAFIDLPAIGGQPAQRITLLDLPVNPEPNTKVATNLDKVSAAIEAALKQTITNTVQSVVVVSGGALSPITDPLLTQVNMGIDQVQSQIIAAAVAQLQPALAPLEMNVIDGTLNEQTKSAANQITVTALDLKVLPVAGANAVQLKVGTSSCGPNGRLVAPAAAAPTTSKAPSSPKKNKTRNPVVPTSVPAGLESAPIDMPFGPWGLASLAGLLGLAAAAGTATYRRGLTRS